MSPGQLIPDNFDGSARQQAGRAIEVRRNGFQIGE
jgi:hypothetical protein